MQNDLVNVSLISPVYNSELHIGEFVEQAVLALEKINPYYEIILVNDASTDNTAHLLIELDKRFKRLKVISLENNVGQHIATSIALKNASGDYIFMMDSDMQIHPSNIDKLYTRAMSEKNWDVISGSRNKRSSSTLRTVGSNFVSKLINRICGTSFEDVGSTFKLFRKPALEKLFKYDYLIQNVPLLIAYLKLKQVEVKIDYNTNNDKSGYCFSDLLSALILALLNFTSGKNSIVFLLSTGVFSIIFSIGAVISLTIRGMIISAPLPTNLLVFVIGIGLFGMQMNMLGLIAYKIERVNRNLDFRKNMQEHIGFKDG